jgi:hypothetical protein
MNEEREEELEEERVERKIEEMEARAREEEERLAGEEATAEEMILAREEAMAEKEEEKVPTITYTGRLVERGNIIEIESGPPIKGRIGGERMSTVKDMLIEHLSPDQIWFSAEKKKVLMGGESIVCFERAKKGEWTILRCGKREDITPLEVLR